MKRIGIYVGLLLVMALSLSAQAATWAFQFPITIQDTSNVTRTDYPVILPVGTSALASYISASGLDTNMQEGASNRKYMMVTDKITTVVPSLPGSGHIIDSFYTGYSPQQTNFSIITGDGGYVTTLDSPSLEAYSSNWSIEVNAYVGSSGNYTRKDGAFNLSNNGTGKVTVMVIGAPALSATGIATGNHTIKYLTGNGTQDELYIDSILEDTFPGIPIWVDNANNWKFLENIPYANSVIVRTGASSNVSPSSGSGTNWVDVGNAFDGNIASQAGIQTISIPNHDWSDYLYLNKDIIVQGLGFYPIDTGANITSVQVDVFDGTSWSSIFNGMPTFSSWNNVIVPSMEIQQVRIRGFKNSTVSDIFTGFGIAEVNYQTYVKLWYKNPTSMVVGSTLPDNSNNSNDGTITWGSNKNITLSYGALISSGSTSLNAGATQSQVPDFPMPSRWFGAYQLTANQADATFSSAFFYTAIHQQFIDGGIPTLTMYAIIFIAAALLIMFLLAIKTRSILVAVMGAMIVLFAGSQCGTAGAIPMWLPTIGMIVCLSLMVSYRQVWY